MNEQYSPLSGREIFGPRDIAEVERLDSYANFGAILVRPTEGMEIKLEVEEGTQRIIALVISVASSTVQLQVYAAPKSGGVWGDVRPEIAQGLRERGGVCEERLGSFGAELMSQIPEYEGDKQVGKHLVRIIGVDGPRWFLRGTITGAAVHDPAAASLIESVVRECIIDRGTEPLPPRELLLLRLPDGVIAPPRPGIEA